MEVRNRFKGVPDELWTEVLNIVQETRSKTMPKKKKCRKAKWLSEEAFIAVKRREPKAKEKRKDNPFECRFPKNSKKR